jgi:hypothetical protein
MSNTRTVLIVRTAVSLPEGFRSCLSSICCGNSEGGPSTAGLVVTSACNWVQTARKIPAKSVFLSLFFLLILLFLLDLFYSIIQPTEPATAIFHNFRLYLLFPRTILPLTHSSTLQPLHNNTRSASLSVDATDLAQFLHRRFIELTVLRVLPAPG